MIDLYTWTTPNGRKISIMLEEIGLPYSVHPVNIGKGEQFQPDFLKISPNNKIPAIVDTEAPGGPLTVFESGAILVYLAEKSGKLLPSLPPARAKALEWTLWQAGGVGPMFGQMFHFLTAAPEKIPYAIERFTGEAARLLKVMNGQLTDKEFIAGEYSIADIMLYPWVAPAFETVRKAKPDVVGDGAGIVRWLKTVGERPAVVRGMAVPKV